MSGRTSNIGRRGSASGRGVEDVARGTATVDARGVAAGGSGLPAGCVSLLGGGGFTMGGARSAAGVCVRTSRERFACARGFDSVASSRTRRR